jgi:hypothetical protein
MKYVITALACLVSFITAHTQVLIIARPLVVIIGAATMPEHGFLPGKAFKFYPTLNRYDFGGKKMRVEIYDERDSLQLIKLDCSETAINNGSEFKGYNGAEKVAEYFDTLFKQSGLVTDSLAQDTVKIHLQALDNRLIGFGEITAHGLCQMRIEYKNALKVYCVDITDKSPHSPIGKNAFVTRKTATRVIQSASIREAIEQFLSDIKAGM